MSSDSPSANPSKLRILLVEDEPTLIDLYTVALKSLGPVEHRGNGQEAMQYVHDHVEQLPDVVLLDLIIPEHPAVSLDFNDRWGFHVLEAIRTHKEYDTVPVFVMTNLDSAEDRTMASSLGARAYIVKSNVIPKQIVELIQGAL